MIFYCLTFTSVLRFRMSQYLFIRLAEFASTEIPARRLLKSVFHEFRIEIANVERRFQSQRTAAGSTDGFRRR